MERYFIIVVDEISSTNKIGKWQKDLTILRDYQNLFTKSLRETNAAPLPQNNLSVEWAICVAKSQVIFKGVGVDAFQEFVSSNFFADIPSETWDLNAFKNLNNCAVDIIVEWDECPEFWKSFNPSNSVKVINQQEDVNMNHQLFWRGSLKMRDPQNPSHFGQLENAELNYGFDQLDLLTSQIKAGNLPHVAIGKRKTFCSFLELVSAFNAHVVPFIFYTSTTLVLSIQQADSFWKSMDENVSFLFRLDYASEGVESREKEMGPQSIYFLSHWTGGALKLFVLKGADQLQNLANVYVRLHNTPAFSVPKSHQPAPVVSLASDHLQLDRLEKEIRRFQLLAIETWIKEKGSIDESTMNEVMNEVAYAVAKDRHRFSSKALSERRDWPELCEAELLKWKLEKKVVAEVDRPVSMGNRLLQPNGRLISVDVPYLLRCLGKKQQQIRSPKKLRSENGPTSRLKPDCDLETARTTQWPQSAGLKYHGINYNLSVEEEKCEKQRSEYQDKWVPLESSWATWCNPWSINISTSYQLSTRSRQAVVASCAGERVVTATRTPRTPKKNQQPIRDLAQLRKSPRLLAKSGATTRTSKRTPSKKNTGPSSVAAPSFPKDTFKQQLKAVIIKVLGDQQITTKDPLFRTCANKLSVICMALFNDSKSQVTPRQMYQVAKSQAKQVLQFVKP